MDFIKESFENFYEIHEEIGSGHFAVVRRCRDKRGIIDGCQEYAAKFIRKKRASASRRGLSMEEITREIEILRELSSHPNVISLREVYDNPTNVILVLELVKGGELFDVLLENKYLEDREAAHYVKQILQGLEHLHSKHIGHLDLKPENIMIKDKETKDIKIIDFGLARKLKGTDVAREMMGTPEFVAPEIINFDPISLSTDMWSLGVITYILLSGASPFLGSSRQETFENIVKVDYIFDEEYFSRVSQCAKQFISQLLVSDPRKRLTVKECLNHRWIKGPSPIKYPCGTLEHVKNGYEGEVEDDSTLYPPTPPEFCGDEHTSIIETIESVAGDKLKKNKNPPEENVITLNHQSNGYLLPSASLLSNDDNDADQKIFSNLSAPDIDDDDDDSSSSSQTSTSSSSSTTPTTSFSNSLTDPAGPPTLAFQQPVVPSKTVEIPVKTVPVSTRNDFAEILLNGKNGYTQPNISNKKPISAEKSIDCQTKWKNCFKLITICSNLLKDSYRKNENLITFMDMYGEDTLLTAFIQACGNDNLLAVQEILVLTRKKNLATTLNKQGESGILAAILNGNLDIVKYLRESIDINYQNQETKETYLFEAVKSGHLAIVKYLVDIGGINVNTQNKNGDTCLHVAIALCHKDIVEFLSSYPNTNPNIKDYLFGNTPLHLATMNGSSEFVNFLCNNILIDLNAHNLKGETALHMATCHTLAIDNSFENETPFYTPGDNNIQSLKKLLSSGANPNPGSCHNFSLPSNSKSNSKNSNTYSIGSPLHYAIQKRNVMAVLLLVDAGADINAIDPDGESPLHLACKEGLILVVQTLCAYGCEVNLPNSKGFYPIHLAARYGNVEICRSLCLACCNISVKIVLNPKPNHHSSRLQASQLSQNNNDKEGLQSLTAYEIALSFGHQDVADLLANLSDDYTKMDASGSEGSVSSYGIISNGLFPEKLIKPFSQLLLGKSAIKNGLSNKSLVVVVKDEEPSGGDLNFNEKNSYSVLPIPHLPNIHHKYSRQARLVAQLLPIPLSLINNDSHGCYSKTTSKTNKEGPSVPSSGTLDPERVAYQTYRLKLKVFGHARAGKTFFINKLNDPPEFLKRLSPTRSLFVLRNKKRSGAAGGPGDNMYPRRNSKFLDRIKSIGKYEDVIPAAGKWKFDFEGNLIVDHHNDPVYPFDTSTNNQFHTSSSIKTHNLNRSRSSSHRVNRISLIESTNSRYHNEDDHSIFQNLNSNHHGRKTKNRNRGASFSSLTNNFIFRIDGQSSLDHVQESPDASSFKANLSNIGGRRFELSTNNDDLNTSGSSLGYTPTQGIGISNINLPSVGEINVWDFSSGSCPSYYRQMYDQFLGDLNSVHTVIFDASQPLSIIVREICSWVLFLRSKFSPASLVFHPANDNIPSPTTGLNCHDPRAAKSSKSKLDLSEFDVEKQQMNGYDDVKLENLASSSATRETHNLLGNMGTPFKPIPLVLIGTRLDKLLSPATIPSLEILRKQILARVYGEIPQILADFDVFHKVFFLDCRPPSNGSGPPYVKPPSDQAARAPSNLTANGRIYSHVKTDTVESSAYNGCNTNETVTGNLIVDNFVNTEWLELIEFLEYQKYLTIQRLPQVTEFLKCTIRAVNSWKIMYSNCPVMTWPLFVEHIHKHVNCLASLDHLKELVTQLQYMGEILYIRCENKRNFIVLDPKWLCTDVLGRLFASVSNNRKHSNNRNGITGNESSSFKFLTCSSEPPDKCTEVLLEEIPRLDIDEIANMFAGFDIVELLPLLEAIELCIQYQSITAADASPQLTDHNCIPTPILTATKQTKTNYHKKKRMVKESTLEYEFPCLNPLLVAASKGCFEGHRNEFYATDASSSYYVPSFTTYEKNDGYDNHFLYTGYRLLPLNVCGGDPFKSTSSFTDQNDSLLDAFPRIQLTLRALIQENSDVDELENGLYQYLSGSRILSGRRKMECLVLLVPRPSNNQPALPSSSSITTHQYRSSAVPPNSGTFFTLDLIARSLYGSDDDISSLFFFLNDVLDIVRDVLTDVCPGTIFQHQVLDPDSLKHHFKPAITVIPATGQGDEFCFCYDVQNPNLPPILSYDGKDLFNDYLNNNNNNNSSNYEICNTTTTTTTKPAVPSRDHKVVDLFTKTICNGSNELLRVSNTNTLTPWWDLPIDYVFFHDDYINNSNQSSPTISFINNPEGRKTTSYSSFNFRPPHGFIDVLKYLCFNLDRHDEHGKDWCLFALSLGLSECLPIIDSIVSPSKHNFEQSSQPHEHSPHTKSSPPLSPTTSSSPWFSRTHFIIEKLISTNHSFLNRKHDHLTNGQDDDDIFEKSIIGDGKKNNSTNLTLRNSFSIQTTPKRNNNNNNDNNNALLLNTPKTMGELIEILIKPCDRRDIAEMLIKMLPLYVIIPP